MNRNPDEINYGLIEALAETMRSSGSSLAELTFNIDKLGVNVRMVVVDLNFKKK